MFMEKKIKNYKLIDISDGQTIIVGYYNTQREAGLVAAGYRAGKKNCSLILQEWDSVANQYTYLCFMK